MRVKQLFLNSIVTGSVLTYTNKDTGAVLFVLAEFKYFWVSIKSELDYGLLPIRQSFFALGKYSFGVFLNKTSLLLLWYTHKNEVLKSNR